MPGLSDVARETLITRHQLALVECEDANNNTPLSEAGGGGHADTIKLLIQKGANVNSKGHYQRTPLWRAAFAGHLQAVQVIRYMKHNLTVHFGLKVRLCQHSIIHFVG